MYVQEADSLAAEEARRAAAVSARRAVALGRILQAVESSHSGLDKRDAAELVSIGYTRMATRGHRTARRLAQAREAMGRLPPPPDLSLRSDDGGGGGGVSADQLAWVPDVSSPPPPPPSPLTAVPLPVTTASKGRKQSGRHKTLTQDDFNYLV